MFEIGDFSNTGYRNPPFPLPLVNLVSVMESIMNISMSLVMFSSIEIIIGVISITTTLLSIYPVGCSFKLKQIIKFILHLLTKNVKTPVHDDFESKIEMTKIVI